METISEIWSLIYNNLLRGIFVSVIIILIAKFIFKNKIDINVSLRIIKIIIISNSVFSIIQFITFLLLDNPDQLFLKRAFGPHWWAYWTMIIMNSLLPLTLLIKRLGTNKFYLLLVTILMNIGWVFESFVIHMTSLERDYMPMNYNPYLPTSHEISVVLNGLIIGVLLLIIGNLYKRITNLNLNEKNKNGT